MNQVYDISSMPRMEIAVMLVCRRHSSHRSRMIHIIKELRLGMAVTHMIQTWLPNIRSRLNAALINAKCVKA